MPGQSRRLPLGASRARNPGTPRPRVPHVWMVRSLPQSALLRTCGAQPFPTTQSRERGGYTPPKCWSPSPSSTFPRPPMPLYQEFSPESPLLQGCVCVSAIGVKMVPHHILPTLPHPTTLPDRKEPRNFHPSSLPWNQLCGPGAVWTRSTFCKIYILP